MKLNKIIAIAMIGVATLFTSCQGNNERTFSTAACEDAAGTYAGGWEKLAVATGELVQTAGSITLSAYQDENGKVNPYVANIVVVSEGSADRTDVCNIAHADDGYVFYNNVGASFGSKFSGEIDAQGNITMQYQVEEQAGRSKKVFKYNFSGKK